MSSRTTLFGEVPNDWTVSTIGEIAELRQGLQIAKSLRISSYKEGYIPLFKIADLQTRKFSEFVTDIKEQYIATEKDIIYTRTGQVGQVYTNLNGCVHNNCFKVLVDYSKFDKYFIYYYLKSDQVLNYSNSVASGSVQKDLKHSAFKSCIIAFPKLQEQKEIAHILSTLDEKIEVNNRINKTLEDMAQEIFKHWFVDFELPNEDGEPYKSSCGEMVESEIGLIPKGWEVETLDQLVEVKYGKDHKKLNDGNIPVYGSGGIMRYVEKFIYQDESVLIPRKGTLDNVIYVNRPFWSVDTMFYTIMRHKNIAKYIYCFMKTKDLVSMNSGSAVPSMTTAILNSIPIITKPLDKIHEFNRIVSPIFDLINHNSRENQKLESIRDTLLPKLMSGEIRVPLDIEEQ